MIFQKIDSFATHYPWILAIICLVIGAIIGHYTALIRDKRKEFNEIADPVRANLRRELNDMRANAQWVKGDDLALLIDMAYAYKRPRLRAAVKAYKESRQQHIVRDAAYGEQSFTCTDHVVKATSDLLSLLRRR